MEQELLVDLVVEAMRVAFDERDGASVPLSRRMVAGEVQFVDEDGRVVRRVAAEAVFKKVTAVRDRLRVLEQKLNTHPKLDSGDKAELQAVVTRAYGSLTTFNFLFRDDDDRFRGTGG